MDGKISLYPEEDGRPKADPRKADPRQTKGRSKADPRQTGHKPPFIPGPGSSRYQSSVSLLSFTKQETYLDKIKRHSHSGGKKIYIYMF